jgi:hypothetical protein
MIESIYARKSFLWLIITVFTSCTVSWAQTGLSRKKVAQERPVRKVSAKTSTTPNWTAIEKSLSKRHALSAVRTQLNGKEAARNMAAASKLLTKPSLTKLKRNKNLGNAGVREANLKMKASRQAFLKRNRKGASAALRRAADEPLTRLYVDEWAPFASVEDGSSWDNAFVQLADALKFAKDNSSVIEIWVAYGIYKPQYATDYSNEASDDRDLAFVLPPNVKIYGGFYGVEELLEERDLSDAQSFGFLFGLDSFINATILSGDFYDDDGDIDDPFEYTSENARHVVIASGNVGGAALDGFVIMGGNADEETFLTSTGFEHVSRASGGAIALYNSSPALTNLVIFNNQAISGSAIFADGSSPVITNTLIVGNKASDGTLYFKNSSPVITNATISDNTADDAGGIYFTSATLAPEIRNTIIYGNTADANANINVLDGVAPNYAYSIIEGSGGSNAWVTSFGTDGNNNLDADPKFYDPVNQNYGLSVTSPAINAGNKDFFLAGGTPDLSGVLTDVRGTERIQKDDIDIGAIESLFAVLSTDLVHTAGRLYVKKGATGNGSSWATPAGEVADALFAAALNPDIQEIWVAGGVYHPLYRPDDFSNDNPAGKLNAFVMVPNVKVYGGFAGIEGALADRKLSITANASILSADFDEDDELDFQEFMDGGDIPETSDENALHILYAVGETGSAVLDGFTIEGANILTTVFTEEDPEMFDLLNESLLINGLHLPVLLGGAVTTLGSNLTFSNLVVKNNLGFLGGGVSAFGSEMQLNNTLIYDNFTAAFGSGLLGFGVDINVINVTIAENFALPFLGEVAGVYLEYAAGQISNSIIYGNMVLCCALDLDTGYDSDIHISNSLIGGSGGSGDDWDGMMGTDGGGNLDEDPVFKDVLARDFSLTPCSKPINAGTNVYYEVGGTPDLSLIQTDLSGNERIYDGTVDMGAYEFQASSSTDLPLLAGDGRASYIDLESGGTYSFTVPNGLCTAALLSLTSTDISGGMWVVSWVDRQVNFFNGAPYVQRHFDIEPDQNPDNVTARVTLYFTQEEFDKFNENVSLSEYLPTGEATGEADRIANLRIYQFHGLSDDESGDPSTYSGGRTTIDPLDEDIVWNEELSRWEVTFDVVGFSGFFAGTKTQSPLPVRLVSFQGKRTDNNTVQLDWKVAEQDQIDAYIVEHSANGKQFNEIGKVFANSLSESQYSFTDEVPRKGQYAYYRLRVMEMEGQKSYSRIVAIKLPASQHMTVYPVPAKTHVWVNWKGSSGNTAELINITGRVLKTIARLEDTQHVDISGLTPGVYILKMADGSTNKILKE